MSLGRTALLVALAVSVATPLLAQKEGREWGFALRGGSLGTGIEVSQVVHPKVALRLGFGRFNLEDRTFTLEDENVDIGFEIDSRIRTFFLLADLTPFAGWFHFTGGVVYNGLKVEALGEPLEDYRIQSRTFTREQIGTLSATLQYSPKFAPYAGFGFGTVARGSPLGLTIDFGLVYTGSLKVDLVGTGMLEPTAEQDAVIQEALDGVKIYPVLTLGLVFRP